MFFHNLLPNRKKLKDSVLLFIWVFAGWHSSEIFAQQIEVRASSTMIRDKNISGFTTCLELDVRSVENGLNRFIRSIGKFDKAERSSWEGLTQVIPAIASDAVDFYSKLIVSPRCVQVFMGALRSGTSQPITGDANDNLNKMLYDFALEQYRGDLKKQIEEAERVVNLAVKAHDKRSREGEDIRYRLNKNRKEKVRLHQELDQNAENLQKLLSDSTRNLAEKETALEEIKKVRQIAEERKQKLSSIK